MGGEAALLRGAPPGWDTHAPSPLQPPLQVSASRAGRSGLAVGNRGERSGRPQSSATLPFPTSTEVREGTRPRATPPRPTP